MSRLRARCPICRTLTAVALGSDYECHSCGRSFAAGLVRVPRAWGQGGEAMADAADLPIPYPEVARIEADTLAEQSLALAAALPERPLVLGGCCCAHVGAVQGLAARHGRLSVIWVDAHGDLNTPESSPSGNEWGMPLRMLIDGDIVGAGDVALVGARSLDPPEEEFIASVDLPLGPEGALRALDGTTAAYVAFDVDCLDPAEGIAVWLPEPDGLRLEEAEQLLAEVAAHRPVVGAGLTGLLPGEDSIPGLMRLCAALGL